MDQDVRSALNTILSAPDFRELQARLDDAGILEVLGIHRREIYHTKALAWLLDPEAGHGMGADPLQSFLHMVWRSVSNSSDEVPVDQPDPAALGELPLDTAVSTAEHVIDDRRRLDVATMLPNGEGDHFPLLIIEYKIDSGEQPDQTQHYANWAQCQHKETGPANTAPWLVFLASRNEEPEDPRFHAVPFEAYREWLHDVSWSGNLTRRGHDVLRALQDAVDTVLDPPSPPPEVASLQALYEKEITLLANASQADVSKDFGRILDQYSAPLGALGIVRRARANYGDSATVEAVTKLLRDRAAVLSNEEWSQTRGHAQLCFYSRKVFQIQARAWPEDREVLWLSLYFDRPWNEKSEMRLTLGSRLPANVKKDTEREIVKSLRDHISHAEWRAESGTLNIARLPVKVEGVVGPKDDGAERAQELTKQSGEQLVAFAADAAAATARWINTGVLQDILAEAASKLDE